MDLLSVILGSVSVVLSLIGILKIDVRQWLFSSYNKLKYRRIEKYNNKIDAEIAFLYRLDDPVRAISYFSGEILVAMFLITLTLFFGFMFLFKVNILFALFGFAVSWLITVFFIMKTVEVAYNLRHLEETIERLEKSKK